MHLPSHCLSLAGGWNSADRAWINNAPAMPLPQPFWQRSLEPCRQGIQIYMDESCSTRKPVARIQRNLLGTRYTVELDPSVKPWRADSPACPHGAEALPDGGTGGGQVTQSCTFRACLT